MKKDRNNQIVKLINNGVAVREIAKKYNITKTKVRQIYAKAQIPKKEKIDPIKESLAIRDALLTDIKESNDLNKRYPVKQMRYLFGISIREMRPIVCYFEKDTEISLNDIINLLSPTIVKTYNGHYSIIPMLQIKLCSPKLYNQIISELTPLNLCPAFNTKWKKCKKKIEEYLENKSTYLLKHGKRIKFDNHPSHGEQHLHQKPIAARCIGPNSYHNDSQITHHKE